MENLSLTRTVNFLPVGIFNGFAVTYMSRFIVCLIPPKIKYCVTQLVIMPFHKKTTCNNAGAHKTVIHKNYT